MFKTVVLASILLSFKLTSATVLELACEQSLDANECIIDGIQLQNSTSQLEMSFNRSKNGKLSLKNFVSIKSNQFLDQTTPTDLTIINSTLTMVPRNDSDQDKVKQLCIKNSTVLLLENGLKSFKKLKILNFEAVKIEEVSNEAFAGLKDVTHIGLLNVSMTNELEAAIQQIQGVSSLTCNRCSIDDQMFQKLLNGFKTVDIIHVIANSIKSIKCDKIVKSQLSELSVSENQVSGLFPTCKLPVVDASKNQIKTLFIHSGTKSIDASMNLIKDVKCDVLIDLFTLNLNDNLLTQLMCISSIATLEQLYINGNKIRFFKLNTFQKLTNLKVISAMNNPIYYYQPNLFSSFPRNAITQISVDRFDFGYEDLKQFYPKLTEVFHEKLNRTCDAYYKILEILKDQNINLYFFELPNCEVKKDSIIT
ncbi:unnamed protein product [Chironomus riparius]|uniref:Uncharacterized protein n=1 Tax=Chironomus riparius TaxID=315576 RepID=A0A9N9WZ90_9DIPT|nr:unnamed protein product [Chironomus riparius]